MSYPLVKASHYIGLAALLGGPVFYALVWKPSRLDRSGRVLTRSDALFRRLACPVMLGGLLLFLASAILDIVRVTGDFYGVVEWEFVQYELMETRMGRVMMVRMAAAALFFVAGMCLHAPGRRPQILGALSAMLGMGIIVSISLLSHQAAKNGLFPVVADVVHLTGTATWGGGLLYFALLPTSTIKREAGGFLRLSRLATRFSKIGLLSVTALSLTGVYMTLLHLNEPAQLFSTEYGMSLLRKLSLFIAIMMVAAVQHFYFVPLLSKGKERAVAAAERFLWLVRVETGLLLGLLIAAGFLTTNMPPHPHG